MRQNAHRARFFGDIETDLDVKASRRRYDAARADPRSLAGEVGVRLSKETAWKGDQGQ